MTEPTVGPLTRGFLFADLRAYTAYAESARSLLTTLQVAP
jgi:hypothetical protein